VILFLIKKRGLQNNKPRISLPARKSIALQINPIAS
jgi:hypothetical protein